MHDAIKGIKVIQRHNKIYVAIKVINILKNLVHDVDILNTSNEKFTSSSSALTD
jgi:hypothetical protein